MNKCEKCGFMHYRTDPCRVAKHMGGKFVAEAPPGTRLTSFAGKIVAAAPDTPPSVLIGDKFEPVMIEQPKLGRPRIHPDRKAYKAQKERERRARLKAEKEAAK